VVVGLLLPPPDDDDDGAGGGSDVGLEGEGEHDFGTIALYPIEREMLKSMLTHVNGHPSNARSPM
jgi:hypothetical protein